MDTRPIAPCRDRESPDRARDRAVRLLPTRWCRCAAPSRARARSPAERETAAGRRGGRDSSSRTAQPAISCSVGHEDVPLVADRPDEPGMLRIGLDLFAQAHDAKVDAAVEGISVALLMQVEDLVSRQWPVRMLRERLEQVEFQG